MYAQTIISLFISMKMRQVKVFNQLLLSGTGGGLTQHYGMLSHRELKS